MALFAKLLVLLVDYWFVSVPVLTAIGGAMWLYNQNTEKERKVRRESETRRQPQKTVGRGKQDLGPNEEFGEDDHDYETNGLVPPAIPEDVEHVPYKPLRLSVAEMEARSHEFYELMNQRRSVRFFSQQPVPKEIIQNIIRTAGTCPSGAHTEPWRFVAVSDPEYKKRIREVVEEEEDVNYTKRMGKQWTTDLKGLKTSYFKEYLTEAPWLLFVFKQSYTVLPDGQKRTNYYHEISTALSGGLLLAAIQNAGLVTLTSTPMNCGPTLKTLLHRPKQEKLLLLLPVGYSAEHCTVPDLKRKELDEIMTLIM